jgi:hypothetical protein
LVIDDTVVAAGIPVPDRNIPTSNPAVEAIVNTLLRLFNVPAVPTADTPLAVGLFAENITRFVVALNVCAVTALNTDPPGTAKAAPANVNVALADPPLFSEIRFAPHTVVNPPNVSAEAAVPFAV